jgi:hypothetical protein
MARTEGQAQNRKALTHDLQHESLGDAAAMTDARRARLKAQLVERLKTPVDEPSWGPDWVRHGERVAGHNQRLKKPGLFGRLRDNKRTETDKDDEADTSSPSQRVDDDDETIIARNLEKSRQVAHYKPLYVAAAMLALVIVLISMFVDYHIIREIWTRALANEFMVVPPALQSSVVFKSLQVVFAVLIVHFMLKLTGAYGRATMITASFVLAMIMIAGLGYLVAYNNMAGGTSTAQQQHQTQPQDSINQLFAGESGMQHASLAPAPAVAADTNDGVSLGLPKLSQTSLAHADSWFWLAFASVVFFIVTTVAALYMQTFENNARNYHIAQDYKHRCRDFALLQQIENVDGSS